MEIITCDQAINEIADTLAEVAQDMIVSVYNHVMAFKAKAVEDDSDLIEVDYSVEEL